MTLADDIGSYADGVLDSAGVLQVTAGTVVTSPSHISTDPLTVVMDGSALAVPVKQIRNFPVFPGMRVALIYIGTEWVCAGAFTNPGQGTGTQRMAVGADTPPELQAYGIQIAILMYVTKFETGVEIGYFFIGQSNKIDFGTDEAILFGTVRYPIAGNPSSATQADVRTNFQIDMFETIGSGFHETIFKDRGVLFKNSVNEVAFQGDHVTFDPARIEQLVGAGGGTAAIRSKTEGTLAGNRALHFAKDGDANPGWIMDFDGSMQWGPGGAAGTDTNVKRLAAGVLGTEALKTIADGAWTGLTLGNGWTNRGAGFPALSWRKVPSPAASIQLVGQIVPGTLTNGTTVATLPVGARPITEHLITARGSSGAAVHFQIATTGTINIFDAPGGTTLVQIIPVVVPLDV